MPNKLFSIITAICWFSLITMTGCDNTPTKNSRILSKPKTTQNNNTNLSSPLDDPNTLGRQSNLKTIHGTNIDGVHSSKGWKGSLPIRFKFGPNVPDNLKYQFELAMQTWESAVCLSGRIFIPYKEDEKSTDASLESPDDLYNTLNDQIMGLYFDYNWEETTNKGSTVLATTVWENDPSDKERISKADIRFNAQLYSFMDTKNQSNKPGTGKDDSVYVDIQSLALHEIGHLLGLQHISYEEDKLSVMNPKMETGFNKTKRVLSPKDVERIKALYYNVTINDGRACNPKAEVKSRIKELYKDTATSN